MFILCIRRFIILLWMYFTVFVLYFTSLSKSAYFFSIVQMRKKERERQTMFYIAVVVWSVSFRFNFLYYANYTTIRMFFPIDGWVDVSTFFFFIRSWFFFHSASYACVFFAFLVLVYSFDVFLVCQKKQPMHEMDRLSWKFQFEWHFQFLFLVRYFLIDGSEFSVWLFFMGVFFGHLKIIHSN